MEVFGLQTKGQHSKGSYSEQFRFCGPYSLSTKFYYSIQSAIDDTQTNVHGCAQIKLYKNRVVRRRLFYLAQPLLKFLTFVKHPFYFQYYFLPNSNRSSYHPMEGISGTVQRGLFGCQYDLEGTCGRGSGMLLEDKGQCCPTKNCSAQHASSTITEKQDGLPHPHSNKAAQVPKFTLFQSTK